MVQMTCQAIPILSCLRLTTNSRGKGCSPVGWKRNQVLERLRNLAQSLNSSTGYKRQSLDQEPDISVSKTISSSELFVAYRQQRNFPCLLQKNKNKLNQQKIWNMVHIARKKFRTDFTGPYQSIEITMT